LNVLYTDTSKVKVYDGTKTIKESLYISTANPLDLVLFAEAKTGSDKKV